MVQVLVVDDSALMRKMLSDILSEDKDISVVGTAISGDDALRKIPKLNPDVVTLDLEMPGLSGLETLKKIVDKYNVPVIIVSSYSSEGSKETIEAMGLGALDFVLKPKLENIKEISDDLRLKIRALGKTKVKKFTHLKSYKKSFNHSRKKIIVIAASTGGPPTLEALLVQLPKNIPCPILVVQHMPPIFTKTFANRLNDICKVEVKEASEGDELKNGTVLIAPGGFHMELIAEVKGMEGVIKLNTKPHELGVRPCANKLFKSVAKIFEGNTIGVVLTGMGSDGKLGSEEIKKYGGTIIAQSEKTCIIYGMPKEVINANLADEILDINDIPSALIQLVEV